FLAGPICGRHAVHPREVVGLCPRILVIRVVAEIEDRAAATLEAIEHLRRETGSCTVASSDDDVAHALIGLEGIDEILHRGRIAGTRPDDLEARWPAERAGWSQGAAGDVDATPIRASCARTLPHGHLVCRDVEATRGPTCVEVPLSIQVDHLD